MNTKNNQNISTESSNDWIVDPIGDALSHIRTVSSVGLPGFFAHCAKSNLSLAIESLRTTQVLDIRSLLYIITVSRAMGSLGISICTYQNSVYFYDYSQVVKIQKVWDHQWYEATYTERSTGVYQICSFILSMLSFFIPLIIFHGFNSQVSPYVV